MLEENKISQSEHDKLTEEYYDTISSRRDKAERGYDLYIEYQEYLNSFGKRKIFYAHLTNNANNKWKPQFMEYVQDFYKEQKDDGVNLYMYDWEIIGFLLEKKDYRNINYNLINLRSVLGWPKFVVK